MNEIPTCPRCGKVCSGGWVSSPITGIVCRECFYKDDFPIIQKQAKANARPWEILFYLTLIGFICILVDAAITIYKILV